MKSNLNNIKNCNGFLNLCIIEIKVLLFHNLSTKQLDTIKYVTGYPCHIFSLKEINNKHPFLKAKWLPQHSNREF